MAGCRAQPAVSYGIRSLEFTDFRGHADFTVRHQERDLKSKRGSSKTSSEETVFEESLTLEADGYVLHPNILDFALGGVFGLVQEDFEEVVNGRKRTSSNDGDLLEFDLRAQFSKKKNYPLSLFAHRRRGLVPRPFLPSLETTTTSYGFTWQYISKKTPVSLRPRVAAGIV